MQKVSPLNSLKNYPSKSISPLKAPVTKEAVNDSVVSLFSNQSYEGPTDSQGRAHGLGTLHVKGDGVYQGEFVHGALCGKIDINYKNGGYLENYNMDGMPYKGLLIKENGHIEAGVFKDHKLHTTGFTLSKSSGIEIQSGIFENGIFTQGMLSSPSGDTHVGSFKNGLLHGHGIYYSPDNFFSELQIGCFNMGIAEGRSKVYSITPQHGILAARILNNQDNQHTQLNGTVDKKQELLSTLIQSLQHAQNALDIVQESYSQFDINGNKQTLANFQITMGCCALFCKTDLF